MAKPRPAPRPPVKKVAPRPDPDPEKDQLWRLNHAPCAIWREQRERLTRISQLRFLQSVSATDTICCDCGQWPHYRLKLRYRDGSVEQMCPLLLLTRLMRLNLMGPAHLDFDPEIILRRSHYEIPV